MKVLNMRATSGTSGIKAYFDFETNDGITIKGFKVAKGNSGLFVGMPSEKGSDGKWYDKVYIPKELKEELKLLALDEFTKVAGPSGDDFGPPPPPPPDSFNTAF